MSSRRVCVSYPLRADGVAPRATTGRLRGVTWRGLRLLARIVLGCGLPLTAGGCSVSLPIAGFVEDPIATGSIPGPDTLLFGTLDQEDGRRARAALAVALDPQGNGASVAWNNPQSGAKGTFVATATPFSAGSRVCRAFRALVEPDPRTSRAIGGSACRGSDGAWLVSEAREVTDAKETRDLRKLRS